MTLGPFNILGEILVLDIGEFGVQLFYLQWLKCLHKDGHDATTLLCSKRQIHLLTNGVGFNRLPRENDDEPIGPVQAIHDLLLIICPCPDIVRTMPGANIVALEELMHRRIHKMLIGHRVTDKNASVRRWEGTIHRLGQRGSWRR